MKFVLWHELRVGDRFPWSAHRTMAEVQRTETLLARQRRYGRLYGPASTELDRLLDKRDRCNPPDKDNDPGSAA